MDEDQARARISAERADVERLLKETESQGRQDRTSEDEQGAAISVSAWPHSTAPSSAWTTGPTDGQSRAGSRSPLSAWRPTPRQNSPSKRRVPSGRRIHERGCHQPLWLYAHYGQ